MAFFTSVRAWPPQAQPLMAAPIKTSSNNYCGLKPQTVTDVNGKTPVPHSVDANALLAYKLLFR